MHILVGKNYVTQNTENLWGTVISNLLEPLIWLQSGKHWIFQISRNGITISLPCPIYMRKMKKRSCISLYITLNICVLSCLIFKNNITVYTFFCIPKWFVLSSRRVLSLTELLVRGKWNFDISSVFSFWVQIPFVFHHFGVEKKKITIWTLGRDKIDWQIAQSRRYSTKPWNRYL